MVEPKVILMSQFPLPYSHIGSWSTLYRNYLSKKNNIDFIVCKKPKYSFDDVNYQIVKNNFWTSIFIKITRKGHYFFITALDKIIKKDQKYIVQIIDNFGLLTAFDNYLTKKGTRNQFYIQYFFHGFIPDLSIDDSDYLYKKIDQLIVLTKTAKEIISKTTSNKSLIVSHLYNGIDTNKFFKVTDSQKQILKSEFNLSDKKVFIWCSQDRPKKGLQIILDLWKSKYGDTNDFVLLVIGCEARTQQINGVKFLGEIQNDLLPKYYQMADAYLFSTQCEEGFGISLIEALHCGCYCIASALGGVPEVLQYGKFGKLIENPADIENWSNAIEEFTNSTNSQIFFPNDLYTSINWNNELDNIIIEAKNKFLCLKQ